ncbi:HNH endonuclease [Ruania suaedae]|uniref:HNH endonuclease signature motif containing protein n=1 Tax=Ruania suaedae TaxID=2897774 RepID=UPI001E541515|nr:HNH endonuclease signature motif containing protein [Ruania suaedae]UFU03616.1 HNH endonuclease [Ruania suaedae]
MFDDDGERSGVVRHCARLIAAHQRLSLAEQLAGQLPGGVLVDRLDLLDLTAVDEATLVEVVAAARRVEAHVQEVALRAAAELAERPGMNPGELAARTGGPSEVAGDELALRLCTSARAGHGMVRRGLALQRTLGRTADALRLGRLDLARAAVIADGLVEVPWQVAMAVEDAVIERAPRRTVAQLRADVARALIAVDPEEAEVRAQARRADRRVSRPQALPDGVASMRLEGPAAEVLALDVALESSARSAKAHGDPRTMDQLRFDALTGLGSRALATGVFGPADRGGSSWAAETEATETDAVEGSSTERERDAGGMALGVIGGRRADIQVVVTLDQLLDVEERGSPDGGSPASLSPEDVPTLTGYGPITPAAARAVAAGGVWRRLVTDPVSRTVVDVGHARYRPPARMAELVRARDGTCVRPGCGHRARYCQLDHTVAFDAGGPTSVTNLGPLCVRDHLLKTHGDFAVTQPESGVFEWITPTGHRYRRERDGATTGVGIARSPAGDPPF